MEGFFLFQSQSKMAPLGNEKSNDPSADGNLTPSEKEEEIPESCDDTKSLSNQEEEDDETRDTTDSSPASSTPSSPSVMGKVYNTSIKDADIIPSFIKVGLEKKASPLALKSWTSLALTLDGRDKITKVLQYTARFLGFWFAGRNNMSQALRFTSLYKTLSNCRKAFRLGRSFIEFEKLRPIPSLILWHLEHKSKTTTDDDVSIRPHVLLRRASSNIGFGPMTLEEDGVKRPSLVSSLSNMAYHQMYRPFITHMSTVFGASEEPSNELWKIVGMSLKVCGLLGFWAGDNCSFLLSSGAFDNYSLSDEERLHRRKRMMGVASKRAYQSYFIGAVSGLITNWYAYSLFQKENNLAKMKEETHKDETQERQTKKLKQQQFKLFLSLLKSCCDVMVFTNMPGIDLHKKLRGKKNHEGLHCLCGLISASTVIYNNFPDS